MVKQGSRAMSNVQNIRNTPPSSQASSNGKSGGRKLTDHRLKELENRISRMDEDLKKVNDTCVEIRTLIKTLMWVGGRLIALASIVIHLMLRVYGS